MKLVTCPHCGDVFNMRRTHVKVCNCGASGGMYQNDGVVAELYGDAVPLGFANQSFTQAIETRPAKGNGREFKAFVIPVQCPTVVSYPERNPVAMVRIVGRKGKKKKEGEHRTETNHGAVSPP